MPQRYARRSLILVGPSLIVLSAPALAGPTPSPKGAYLYFIRPRDHQKVRSPVLVVFGLRGMGVAPAGVRKPNTGHHHLFVDVDEPLNPDVPIPQDKKHLHFGAGQTEARVDLPKGRHTLQLVLGDADHIPFNPPVVSKKIHIIVV